MTKVVNARHCKIFDEYCGRGSKWGNKYSTKPSKYEVIMVATKAEAIAKYEEWLLTRPELMSDIPRLKDKKLACYCAPKGGCTAKDPLCCHVQIIAKYADAS